MKHIYKYQKKSFCFRRWNRAGYSAFMSIGKQITIGHVASIISDGLLRDAHLRSLILAPILSSDEDDESPNEDIDDGLTNLFEQVVVCPVSQVEVVPARCRNVITFLVRIRELMRDFVSDNFLFTFNCILV